MADGTTGRQLENGGTSGLTRWMGVAEEGGRQLTQPQEMTVAAAVEVEDNVGNC